ncbi:MAG: flagellar biosynthetic protein FliO [Bryobacteraceae bacterium]
MIVVVLGILALTLWGLRRKGIVQLATSRQGARLKRLESIERLPLTPNHSLHLVRVDDRLLFVGVSPSGCHVLEISGSGMEQSGKQAQLVP